MISHHTFYLEFLEQLDCLMVSGLKKNRWLSRLYNIDFSRSMLNWLWYSRLNYRDTYCQLRVDGKSVTEAMQPVALPGERLPEEVYGNIDSAPRIVHPWQKILSSLAGRVLIYVNGIRNYHYNSSLKI